MDLLKEELQRKRMAVADDFCGKSFVRRSELEQKQLQKRRDDNRRKLLARAPARADSAAASGSGKQGVAAGSANTSSSSAATAAAATAASSVPPPPALELPRHEVVRRLRVLREPVTLFGEDDAARAERFMLALKSGVVDDIDGPDMAEGQTDEFLSDMIKMRKRHKAARGDIYAKCKFRRLGGGVGSDRGVVAGASADDEYRDDADMDSKRMSTKFEELCEEDKILVFFKRLLNEWKQELGAMTELEKRIADGKFMIATFKQSARDLTPLFELCRKKVIPDDIRQALLVIVQCCIKHDYLAASEQYIKLAIGNAPWPIGVTMVGIHERSAREKIYAKSVAHIMNDETTRRYLQSIKRLMTLCQTRYSKQPEISGAQQPGKWKWHAGTFIRGECLSEENVLGKASREVAGGCQHQKSDALGR